LDKNALLAEKSMMEICNELRNLNLSNVAENIQNNSIDGKQLIYMFDGVNDKDELEIFQILANECSTIQRCVLKGWLKTNGIKLK
jgi:hypothetical protein